jgi:hypothetical protein
MVSSRGDVARSGWQRRHARKPARAAAAALPKNSTFSGFGRREGQVGRQKTPVVFTA